MIEPVFGHTRFNRGIDPVPAKRPLRSALGMAISDRDTQPSAPPLPPISRRRGLRGPRPLQLPARPTNPAERRGAQRIRRPTFPTATFTSSTVRHGDRP
jgi:hypothetical protein